MPEPADQEQWPFACPHTTRILTVRPVVNGAITYTLFGTQCAECGCARGVKTSSLSASQKASAVPPDPDIHRRYRERNEPTWRAWLNQRAFAKQTAWWARYRAHLDSWKWRELRALVMTRAEHLCEVCYAAPAEHVHHLTYQRLGAELLTDLLAVCLPCHASLHPDHDLAGPNYHQGRR